MFNLILAVISTVIALIGAEIFMRLLAPQPAMLQSPGLYITDAATGYRHQPGHVGFLSNRVEYETKVEINKQGLRGQEIRTDRGQTRLIVLGDSFVFGQGVEADETFSAYLETTLMQQGHNVEVLNAGVRGYGTVQEATWLQHYGMQLAPDVVILGIFLGNDVSDNAMPVTDRWRLLAQPRAWHTPVTKWLYTHSHIYGALRTWWQQGHPLGTQQHNLDWLRRTYSPINDATRKKELEATENALDTLVDLTRPKGITLMAVLIPNHTQVEPERQAIVQKLLEDTPGFDLAYPNELFSGLLAARDIPYLDPTPIFHKQAQAGEVLYYPTDGHWNPAGQKLAADSAVPVIADVLRGLSTGKPSLVPQEN